jgi:hypothetical protein
MNELDEEEIGAVQIQISVSNWVLIYSCIDCEILDPLNKRLV